MSAAPCGLNSGTSVKFVAASVRLCESLSNAALMRRCKLKSAIAAPGVVVDSDPPTVEVMYTTASAGPARLATLASSGFL